MIVVCFLREQLRSTNVIGTQNARYTRICRTNVFDFFKCDHLLNKLYLRWESRTLPLPADILSGTDLLRILSDFCCEFPFCLYCTLYMDVNAFAVIILNIRMVVTVVVKSSSQDAHCNVFLSTRSPRPLKPSTPSRPFTEPVMCSPRHPRWITRWSTRWSTRCRYYSQQPSAHHTNYDANNNGFAFSLCDMFKGHELGDLSPPCSLCTTRTTRRGVIVSMLPTTHTPPPL